MGWKECIEACLSRWLRFSEELLEQKESIVHAIGVGFGAWAGVCYRYPYHVISVSFVVFLAMTSGLLPPTPQWIDGAEKLYSLPFSRARDDGELHNTLFGDVLGRKSVVILKHSIPGENILTWEHLNTAEQVDRIVRGKEVDPQGGRKLFIPRMFGDVNDLSVQEQEKQYRNIQMYQQQEDSLDFAMVDNPNVHRSESIIDPINNIPMVDDLCMTFEDICLLNATGQCTVDSVLSFGLKEFQAAGLFPTEKPEIWVFHGTVFSPQQVAFIPEYFLGKMHKEPCRRKMPREVANRVLSKDEISELPEPNDTFVYGDIECVTKVEAFMLTYDLDGSKQYEDRNSFWERLFIQILKDNKRVGDLDVTFQAFRSRDDELKASTAESKDVVYVVFTFFILATYSTALNFSCDLYRNKLFSSIMGFASAFLGLGAGMGIVSYMGMPMVPTVLICPFLVLGIGVDDMFVIMNSYCVSYNVQDAEKRCIQALQVSGLGISITTLTNLISFGVGAFSTYMSIRNFCVYSALALLMGYVFVLTVFFPCLCIDAKREYASKVCPCFISQNASNEISNEVSKSLKNQAETTQGEENHHHGGHHSKHSKHHSKHHTVIPRERHHSMDHEKHHAYMSQDSHMYSRELYHPNIVSRHSHRSTSGDVISEITQEELVAYRVELFLEQEELNKELETVKSKSATKNLTFQWSKLFFWKKSQQATDVSKDVDNNRHASYPKNVSLNIQDCVYGTEEKKPKCKTTVVGLDPDLAYAALYHEPHGNVGRLWRLFFQCYYGPFITHPSVKLCVLFLFGCIMCVSIYGFRRLQLGLDLSELAPAHSYMRAFDQDFSSYFNKFDQPTDVFFAYTSNDFTPPNSLVPNEQLGQAQSTITDNTFLRPIHPSLELDTTQFYPNSEFTELTPLNLPNKVEWWRPDVQNALRLLHNTIESRESTSRLVNPLLTMINDPHLGPKLTQGNKQIFEETIYYQLSHARSPYRQFKLDFVWSGRELVTWRMRLLPKYMETSEQRAAWMKDVRDACDNAFRGIYSTPGLLGLGSEETDNDLPPLPAIPYTYMMIFYESDLGILSSVLVNMLSAGVAMLLVAFLLIPKAVAGSLVIVMICLIDLSLFGFMYFWKVKLHMVSTIALVISIGFAVDYSAHMCHCFTHCKGKTRDKRVIECLVLMGNPLFHGATSTLLGVLLLGFSESFVFIVFFKMMVMVVVFGAAHGMILLPVILSYIGPMDEIHESKPTLSCSPRSSECILKPAGDYKDRMGDNDGHHRYRHQQPRGASCSSLSSMPIGCEMMDLQYGTKANYHNNSPIPNITINNLAKPLYSDHHSRHTGDEMYDMGEREVLMRPKRYEPTKTKVKRVRGSSLPSRLPSKTPYKVIHVNPYDQAEDSSDDMPMAKSYICPTTTSAAYKTQSVLPNKRHSGQYNIKYPNYSHQNKRAQRRSSVPDYYVYPQANALPQRKYYYSQDTNIPQPKARSNLQDIKLNAIPRRLPK